MGLKNIKFQYLVVFLGLLYIGSISAYETISLGVFYKNFVTYKPRQSIHVLITNPNQVNIALGIANDKCASSEKTTSIANKHNVIAAINGGFFDFGCKNKFLDSLIRAVDCLGYSNYKAFPMYTLKNNNNYYSVSHFFTGAIGWDSFDQQPAFGIIKTNIDLSINNKTYEVSEFNKPHPKKPTLYSEFYDKKSPSLYPHCDEIIIEDNHIKKIRRFSSGKTDIPKLGWVYVIPKCYSNLTKELREGDIVSIKFMNDQKADTLSDIYSENISGKKYILASTPLLICNNRILPNLKDFNSTFYTNKHPRSAVGVLKDNNWVFIVVDGRQKHSEGFTILELAEFMKGLGCTGALNLDGGGSSTMVINNKIVNSLSGREYSLFRKERPISNALLIYKPQNKDCGF